jgi:hypothetical protein
MCRTANRRVRLRSSRRSGHLAPTCPLCDHARWRRSDYAFLQARTAPGWRSADRCGRGGPSWGDGQEAISRHEQNLASYERVLGPGHPNTLTSRYNLAIVY